jgi:hypothetical protein
MSDYLGMLAARYLNQGSSIRPEPVSIYQPPSPDWQLTVDSSPSEEVPFEGADAGGALPLVPSAADVVSSIPSPAGAASFTPSTSEGASFARSPSGEGTSIPSRSDGPSLRPSPARGGGQGGGSAKREIETTAQPAASDAPMPPSRTGEASPLTAPSGSEPGGRARDVRAEPSIVERVVETVRDHTVLKREVVTIGDAAVQRVHGGAASQVPRREPVQPPHPTAAPRGEQPSTQEPSATVYARPERRTEPPTNATIPSASSAAASAAPSAPLFAQPRTPPLIREGTTERPPLRVAPSLSLPQIAPGRTQTSAPTLPSLRGAREVAASRGGDIYANSQPIVEISIDEINIRAAPPPPLPAAPRRDRLVRPPMSLDDYLRRRAGSGR